MGVFHFEGVSGKFDLDGSSFGEEVSNLFSQNMKPPRCLVISGNLLSTIVTKSIIQPCAGPAPLISSPILTSAPWGPALIKDTPTKLCFRVCMGEGRENTSKDTIFLHMFAFFRKNSYIRNCLVKAHFDIFYWNLVDLQC